MTIGARTSDCFFTALSDEPATVHATSMTEHGPGVCDTESPSRSSMTTSPEPTGTRLPLSPVLIAIPAYNEEQTIEAVVKSVRSTVPQFDVLVVNDGSTD